MTACACYSRIVKPALSSLELNKRSRYAGQGVLATLGMAASLESWDRLKGDLIEQNSTEGDSLAILRY